MLFSVQIRGEATFNSFQGKISFLAPWSLPYIRGASRPIQRSVWSVVKLPLYLSHSFIFKHFWQVALSTHFCLSFFHIAKQHKTTNQQNPHSIHSTSPVQVCINFGNYAKCSSRTTIRFRQHGLLAGGRDVWESPLSLCKLNHPSMQTDHLLTFLSLIISLSFFELSSGSLLPERKTALQLDTLKYNGFQHYASTPGDGAPPLPFKDTSSRRAQDSPYFVG